jgi:hypothetical protein
VETGPVGQLTDGLRWDLLEAQPPGGERLTVRTAMPGHHEDVLIAIDAARRRHILVGIPPGEPGEFSERISRGIAVRTVEMDVGSGRRRNFLEIACLESHGHAALDVIAGELIGALEAGASIGRIRLVMNVLARWRRFWAGVSQGLLSREQQLGLFGELWFLGRWLIPGIGVQDAVQAWRGPMGARHDFEAPGLGIETKTTLRQDGAHVIHGLEQLLEPPGGSLFLFSLAVRDEASGTESLPGVVQMIRSVLGEDHSSLGHFESTLYASGYDDRNAPEYARLVLRVRSEELYRVFAGFPRLVPGSLITGIPPGVGDIRYELRLDAALPWLVADSPSSAAVILAGNSPGDDAE